MDSSNLSKTVGPNLLWREGGGDSIDMLVNSAKINDLVKTLIDDYHFFFPVLLLLPSKKSNLEFRIPFNMMEIQRYCRTSLVNELTTVQWMSFEVKVFGHKKSIQCLAPGFQDTQLWSCDSNG